MHQHNRSTILFLRYVRARAVSIPSLHTFNPLSRLKTSWDGFFHFPQSSVSQHLMQRSWIASESGLESQRSLLATMRSSMPRTQMSCLMLIRIQYFVRECQSPCLSSLKEKQRRMISARSCIVNPPMCLTFLGEGIGRHCNWALRR